MAEPTNRNGMAWACRDRVLSCAERPLVMGILNVTPDSFSDGWRYLAVGDALRHGLRLLEEGADLLDIGGESSRPGAQPVSTKEELARVLPVLKALRAETSAPVSIDTTKAEVARCALLEGADIVNDISALTADPGMAAVVAEARAGVVLMHCRGTPETMQQSPVYRDVVGEVREVLRGRMEAAVAAGIRPDALVVDPGIGFGKTVQHNVDLLAGLPALCALGRPVLVGVSRKSFLGHLLGREVGDRLAGSLGALAFAVLRGAGVLRVHDAKESCEVARLLAILRTAEERR